MGGDNGVYRLKPFAVPKPWGGGHLDCFVENDTDKQIGEYVLFSDLEQFPVDVEVNGKNLRLADFWPSLRLESKEIPFMLKLLSTADSLSVQNHPSDADVVALGLQGEGKFECWTILSADNTARAYLGLKPGEKPEVLHTLSGEAHPLSHFNDFSLKTGDVIKLAPGLIHSTTGRLLFYEIQQKSDHTFRIYDFGRPRELHLKEAIYCVRDQKPDIKNFSHDLHTEKFQVAYHHAKDSVDFIRQGKDFSVCTWFGGAAEFKVGEDVFTLSWGDSLLVLTGEMCSITKKEAAIPDQRFGHLPMIDMLFEAYV